MACKSPLTQGNVVFPCGQCLPCRKAKAFDWSIRQDLEAAHQRLALGRASSFLTLTYAPRFVPAGGTLVPAHLQRFLRTLRQRLRRYGGHEFRFYGCGEYGERTGRPHLHVNIFGYAPADLVGGMTFRRHVLAAWGRGHVVALPFRQGAASYTSGYVVKGLYQAHNPALAGRHPEFRRASLKPGLGAPAVDFLAASLDRYASAIDPAAPSAETVTFDDRQFDLRGYLAKRYRSSLGFTSDELRAAGRAFVTSSSVAMAAARLARLDEDHGPRATGGNPNVLATALAIYTEATAEAVSRLETSHARIEGERKRTF